MIRMTEKQKTIEKIVPDTSVIISGILTKLSEKGDISDAEVILPEFVIEELRAQASKGREIGFKGLEEIKKLRQIKEITLKKTGRRQTYEEIQLAKYGRIDALILDIAREEGAVLYTSDMVQHMTAEAEGIRSRYFEPYSKKERTVIDSLMTEDTMSLHIKVGVVPKAKRGMPGNFSLVKIREKPIEKEEIEDMIKEILDSARYDDDSMIEIGGHTATVVQKGNMRISITRPPFSDDIEITVVRPIAKLTLDDYKLSDKLKERFSKKVEGVIISGPPGSGKSTFAASLAEFLEKDGKIVKTLESPRDMQVSKDITQYSKLRGSFENSADLMLLVRPDYTIFDEVRKTDDFNVFADMRLAGIGMVGVVHATDPISSVQRFVGRVELGMIPHIIDTIIYVNAGRIEKVYTMNLTVRTPHGMTEADLARPVVEVKDFETGKLEYEIYSYGEETMIIPVQKEETNGIEKIARNAIASYMKKFDSRPDVEILDKNRATVRVDNDSIAVIIGKKGKTIKEIEEKLGIRLEILPKSPTLGKETEFEYDDRGPYMTFSFRRHKPGETMNFYSGSDFLFSAMIGKSGTVKVAKKSEQGEDVMAALIRQSLKVFE